VLHNTHAVDVLTPRLVDVLTPKLVDMLTPKLVLYPQRLAAHVETIFLSTDY
jgi:hypothetical protein